jgi:phosphomannomutase/phosphoglucomutase
MLKPTIFREYDIRGIADRDLLSEDVVQLGRAIGTTIRRQSGPKVNIGRDARVSGPRVMAAMVEGLVAAGCQVTDIGQVPTPVLYHSAFKSHADGSVMITASHNPKDYNGTKVMIGKNALYGEGITKLYDMIQRGDFDSGSGSVTQADAVPAYVDDIASQFHFSRRLKVVFDAANGAAGPVFQMLLDRLNIEATTMFFEPDGTFPNHPADPTVPKNLEPLIAKVAELKADMGIGFDGDVDRIGAVDEQGGIIFGDMMMLIYGREILTRKPGATFIGEVKCSQILYDELSKLGGHPIMYRTGHSLIKAKMKEVNAELAGEMSGHMFFADRFYGFDDAMYSALRLIEIVDQSGQPLSAQLAGLPPMVSTPEMRIDVPDEKKFDLVARLVARFKQTHKVIDIDGARVQFGAGWGLVRASNTQPALVLRFEAADPQLLAEYQKAIEGAILAEGVELKPAEH